MTCGETPRWREGGWARRAGRCGAKDGARWGEPSIWQMGAVTADTALGHQHQGPLSRAATPCDDPSVRCCAPMKRCDGDGSGMVAQVGRRPSRETSRNRRSPRLLPAKASTTVRTPSALPKPEHRLVPRIRADIVPASAFMHHDDVTSVSFGCRRSSPRRQTTRACGEIHTNAP